MKISLKRTLAIIAGLAVVTSSAVVSYAAQSPGQEPALKTVVSPATARSEIEAPVELTLRYWKPFGDPNRAEFTVVVHPTSDQIESMAYAIGEGNTYFIPVAYDNHIVGIVDGPLIVTIQTTMKNGEVLYKTFYVHG